MKKDLIIVGAGGCGREVLEIVKDINKIEERWNILGFINDIENALDEYVCDYSIIGTIEKWIPQAGQEFVCAIADPCGKELVTQKLENRGAKFVSAIHPTAKISDYTTVGKGLVMYPGAIISVNSKIGDFVTLLSSKLGHDVKVGNYCTISAFCGLGGGVTLEEKVFLGSHVAVVPHKKIGRKAFIATGSMVMTNIREGYRVMGNPARKMDF